MNTKPLYLLAKWQVKENELNKVLALLPELVAKTRQEPGNLAYNVHQSTTDANTIVLYEIYTDEAAVSEHRNSAHFKTIVTEQIAPLLQNRESVLTRQIIE